MTIERGCAMNVWPTLRIVVRTWRRTPALAFVIVSLLALGIGATTTLFTVAYSVLFQRFPFPDAERLVWITTYDSRGTDNRTPVIGSNRLPQFADWQQHLTSFEQVGAWAGGAPDVFTVTGAGTPERVSALRVTHQLLRMLGASPVVGRLFRAGDDEATARSRPRSPVIHYASLVDEGAGSQGDWEIRVARPETGDSATLARIAATRIPIRSILVHMSLSPDGSSLALPLTDGMTTNLWLLPTDGGALRAMTAFGERAIMISRRIAWAPDSHSVYAAIEEMDADVISMEGLLPERRRRCDVRPPFRPVERAARDPSSTNGTAAAQIFASRDWSLSTRS